MHLCWSPPLRLASDPHGLRHDGRYDKPEEPQQHNGNNAGPHPERHTFAFLREGHTDLIRSGPARRSGLFHLFHRARPHGVCHRFQRPVGVPVGSPAIRKLSGAMATGAFRSSSEQANPRDGGYSTTWTSWD